MAAAAVGAPPKPTSGKESKALAGSIGRIEYYEGKVQELCGSFRRSLETGKASTIVERMLRSQQIFDVIAEFSAEAQKAYFRGSLPTFSVDTILHAEFRKCLQRYCASEQSRWNKLLANAETMGELWKECQRICAESSTFMQYADLHCEETSGKADIREEVLEIFRSSFSSGLLKGIEEGMMKSIIKHRETEEDVALKHAKDCYGLRLAFTPAPLRDEGREMIEAHYLTSLTGHLKKWVVLDEKNLKKYLNDISVIIDKEMQRAHFLFTERTTAEKAKLTIQKTLLSSRATNIVNNSTYGVQAAVNYPALKHAEFRQLYNVFDWCKTSLKTMRGALAASVNKALEIRPVTDPKFIQHLITVKAAFAKLVSAAVGQKDQLDFHLAVQEGVAAACPTNGTFEEAITARIDNLIRSNREVSKNAGPGTPSTSDYKAELIKTLDALSLVTNPQLFVDYYKKMLSQRLLLKKSPNFTVEKYVCREVERLRGASFFKHVSVMLQEAEGSPVLCNAALWPGGFAQRPKDASAKAASDQQYKNFHPAIATEFASFVGGQKKVHPGRDVWVDTEHSVVELQMKLPGAAHPCRILGTAPQAQVLLTFGARPAEALDEAAVASLSGLPAGQVAIALLTLTSAGLLQKQVVPHAESTLQKIGKSVGMTKAPKGAKSITYTLNGEYMKDETGPKKIALPTVGPKKQEGGIAIHTDPAQV